MASSRLEPKKSGGYRHIVDLRPLNVHFDVPRVKFESLSLLPALSLAGDKAIGVDLQSGYYALGIDPLY